MTNSLIVELARVKAVFQQRAIAAILEADKSVKPSTAKCKCVNAHESMCPEGGF